MRDLDDDSKNVSPTYRLGRWIIREDWPLWILLFGSVIAAILLYPTLPERFPGHWNVHGQVNAWMSRAAGAFGTLSVAFTIYGLMLLFPLVDPRRESYPKFHASYRVLRSLLVASMVALWGISIAAAKGARMRVDIAVPVVISLLFIVLGNQMGRLRYNWFVGIRTPWSLANETAWRMTHRTAAPVWVAGGFISLIGAFFGGTAAAVAMIIGVGGAAIFSIAYSYYAFQRSKGA